MPALAAPVGSTTISTVESGTATSPSSAASSRPLPLTLEIYYRVNKYDLAADPVFGPLLVVLASLPSSPAPLGHVVSALLSAKAPELIERYGFKRIATKAVQLNLVELGGGANDGHVSRADWIALKDGLGPNFSLRAAAKEE